MTMAQPRGSVGERMRSIGDLVAKHCRAVCPFPEGSLRARLWRAELDRDGVDAAGLREKDTRETARVSRARHRVGRGRSLRGTRGEWTAGEIATLREALAEGVELCRLTALLPERSAQAIYLKAHRLRRAGGA